MSGLHEQAPSSPPDCSGSTRSASAPPGRDERLGVWGAMSGPWSVPPTPLLGSGASEPPAMERPPILTVSISLSTTSRKPSRRPSRRDRLEAPAVVGRLHGGSLFPEGRPFVTAMTFGLPGIFVLVGATKVGKTTAVAHLVAGVLACPVCGNPTGPDFTAQHKGRTYEFCSESCKIAFEVSPSSYL